MKTANQPKLDTVAKFHRLLAKEGVGPDHINTPNNSVVKRRNLADYLKKGCPKVNDNGEVVTNQLPEGHELAHLILGDDYITAEEVATAYGVSYTDDQMEHFADTLPDMQTILWLRANGYMLVAGMPTELNLLQVRELDNKVFYSKTEGWYAESEQKFAREDKVACGEWLEIRKEEVPNSLRKRWDEQQDLITEVVEGAVTVVNPVVVDDETVLVEATDADVESVRIYRRSPDVLPTK